MHYKTILSSGFFLLCLSVLINTLQTASAYSNGPTVSMGSNPIVNATQACSSWNTLFTNNSAQTFIITDVIQSYPGSNVASLRINGQYIFSSIENHHFQTGLKIAPGESVVCANSGNYVTISGYYTH